MDILGPGSTQRCDYVKPTPKPVVTVPSPPALLTKPPGFFPTGSIDRGFCECDNCWKPQVKTYHCLHEKEQELSNGLEKVRREMNRVANEILESSCGQDDSKMVTMYQLHYSKADCPLPEYRPLCVDTDAPENSMGEVAPSCRPKRNTLLDPTSFRYSPVTRPGPTSCRPVTFATTPLVQTQWFTPYPGRTEYQDTIGKNAISIVRSMQLYREPLPTSRRKPGDRTV